jgi:hypothetical protein
MPKAPHKVVVTVVGPQQDEMDTDRRRMSVEVEIQHKEDRHWSSDYTTYRIDAWASRNRYGEGWFQPVMPKVEVPVYGRSISQEQAEKVVKDLKALFRYIDKLPVRPRNLEEMVTTLGAMHNIKNIHLATAPDSHTRMDHQETNIQRAARVAQMAYDRLVPEE